MSAMIHSWPSIHPAIAPLLRIERALRRQDRAAQHMLNLDPVARFLAEGGRIMHLPEHVAGDHLTYTAMPHQAPAVELADEPPPTPEQALIRMVLALAVVDATNGGGSRTPMKERPRVKRMTLAWFRAGHGHWRILAAKAGFDVDAKEREYRKRGLLP